MCCGYLAPFLGPIKVKYANNGYANIFMTSMIRNAFDFVKL